jgi:hypothetical protein
MVPLDDPPAGRPAPVLAKQKVEARAAKTANKSADTIGQARRRGDLPARRRSARLGGRTMADQQTEAGHPVADAIPRGERKPARRREVGLRTFAGQFGNDTRESAAAQSILHCPEHIGRARHAQHQQPRRREPEPVEAWAIGAAALAHGKVSRDPEHLAARPAGARRSRNSKSAHRRQMERRRGGKLMQRATGQPAAEHGIDWSRQLQLPVFAGQRRPEMGVDTRKRFAETLKRGLGCGLAHGIPLILNVHYLFL